MPATPGPTPGPPARRQDRAIAEARDRAARRPGLTGVGEAGHAGRAAHLLLHGHGQGWCTPTTSFYAAGTHTWPYWQADLRAFLSFLQTAWASPLPAPGGSRGGTAAFSYRATATEFSARGWTFSVAGRNLPAFTDLTGVTSGGFVIRGGGTVTVASPALYPAGSRWTVHTGADPGEAKIATADGQGRLTFTVALGPIPPANYLAAITAPGPSDPATATEQVTIEPAP